MSGMHWGLAGTLCIQGQKGYRESGALGGSSGCREPFGDCQEASGV